mgnify:CR=1 FL=1
MAAEDPVILSPVPGMSNIEAQSYVVSTQGLEFRTATADALTGLDLLTFVPYTDPRITAPTVVGRIMYGTTISITKKYDIANQAPWFYGTGLDADGHSHSGWFQKE